MSGSIIKADKDYSKEVDKAIPEAEQLAKVCLHHATDQDNADSSAEQCYRSSREASRT